MFDPEGQLELVDLLLVGEVGQDGGPAAVLQGQEVPLQHPQGHLRLGGRAADDWVERFRDFLQATEGHPQALAVLVVGEGAGDAVEVEADGGGDVLPERLDVGLVPGAVPQQALVGQAPRGVLLTQHVHKGVHV